MNENKTRKLWDRKVTWNSSFARLGWQCDRVFYRVCRSSELSTKSVQVRKQRNRPDVHTANNESHPLPLPLSRCPPSALLWCLCSIEVLSAPAPLFSISLRLLCVLLCRSWSLSPSPSTAVGTLLSESIINPFRTAVSLWGQTTQISSSLSPKRDCGSKGVNIITYY